MRFNDDYKNQMDDKKLSEAFIRDLAKKMDAEAGDGTEDPEVLVNKEFEPIEQTVKVETKIERSRCNMYIRIAASAAAALIVFGSAAAALSYNRSHVDPDNEYLETENTVTSISDTNDVTEYNNKNHCQTSVPDVTLKKSDKTNKAQTTKKNDSVKKTETTKKSEQAKQTQTSKNYNEVKNPDSPAPAQTEDPWNSMEHNAASTVVFHSPDELVNYINARTADESPLITGYEAAGYEKKFSQFYNVSFTADGLTAAVKDHDSRRSIPGWFAVYNDDTNYMMQANKTNMDMTDVSDFSGILSCINIDLGCDGYYIYDAYKYDFVRDINAYGGHVHEDINGLNNYCVEVIPKDYYDEYKNHPENKSDFVVTYSLENGCTRYYDSDDNLTSEQWAGSRILTDYHYFVKTHQLWNDFCADLNSSYSDIAASAGYISYNSDCCINTPYTSWVKDTSDQDFYFRYHIEQNTKQAYPVGESADTQPEDINICLYFKPGTSEAAVMNRLREMKPFFEKYKVNWIVTDVLKDESDFDRIRNSGGFIPDMTINSSSGADSGIEFINRYHAIGNDFNSWSSK